MNFAPLLALPLAAALEEVRAQGLSATLTTSAPPFFPRGYTPQWGAERVLRVKETSAGKLELLVGRELIGEERLETPKNSRVSG